MGLTFSSSNHLGSPPPPRSCLLLANAAATNPIGPKNFSIYSNLFEFVPTRSQRRIIGLLEAAIRNYATIGIEKTTYDSIAKAAKVSRPLVQHANLYKPIEAFSAPSMAGTLIVPPHPSSHLPGTVVNPTHDGTRRGLVVVFKNSPDDWFALLRVLATENGREALSRGGGIVEGFETETVSRAVRSFLADLGETEIPVAAGYHCQPGEVDSISNFKGELALYKQEQGLLAFANLSPAADRFHLDASALLLRAAQNAKLDHTTLDMMLLGDGIDFFREVKKSPGLASAVSSLFVMGGGRFSPDGKTMVLSRNWLPNKEEVIEGLERIAASGKNVFVFSSNEFGGSLVAKTSGEVGNGAVAFTKLEALAGKYPAIRSASNYWLNWSRIFAWAMSKTEAPVDPNKAVDLVTISPLGLVIADDWSSGELVSGRSRLRSDAVSLAELATPDSQLAGQGRVHWLKRDGGQEIVPLANRFSKSIDNVITSVEANFHHHVVRDQSIFSSAAAESLSRLSGPQTAAASCKKIVADLGTPDPNKPKPTP